MTIRVVCHRLDAFLEWDDKLTHVFLLEPGE